MADRIGELLVRENLISLVQLKRAQADQRTTGKRLSYSLARLGILGERELADFLSEQYGVPWMNLINFEIDPKVIELVPKAIAIKHGAIPVQRAGSTLLVAMVDPSNIYAIDDIKFITNLNVEPVVSTDGAIDDAIARYYGRPPTGRPLALHATAPRGPTSRTYKPRNDALHVRRPIREDETLFGWIHLSDIHIGHGDKSHGWDQEMVLDRLCEDFSVARSLGAPAPDAILVTGDIAFSGAGRSPDEYDRAKARLLAMGALVGCGPDRIFTVPGNHDVDRNADRTPFIASFIESLRKGETPIDTALADDSSRTLLAKRMTKYLEMSAAFAPALPGLWWPGLARENALC